MYGGGAGSKVLRRCYTGNFLKQSSQLGSTKSRDNPHQMYERLTCKESTSLRESEFAEMLQNVQV